MTSKTEAAHLALVAAIKAKANEAGSPFLAAGDDPPEFVPSRNEDLVSRLVGVADGVAMHLNIWDGDRPNPEEMLGADLGVPGGYDIELHASIEFAVAGGAPSVREAKYDAGRQVIVDAIKPDLSGGAPVFLGGAVDHLRLIDYQPPGSGLNSDGLPGVKAGVFKVAMFFTSDEPF